MQLWLVVHKQLLPLVIPRLFCCCFTYLTCPFCCRASSIGRREYPPLTGKSFGFIKSDNLARMQVGPSAVCPVCKPCHLNPDLVMAAPLLADLCIGMMILSAVQCIIVSCLPMLAVLCIDMMILSVVQCIIASCFQQGQQKLPTQLKLTIPLAEFHLVASGL